MEVKKVAVIGAGTMGNGIAQVFAHHGYPVVMIDIKDEFVQKGIDTVGKSLARLVKKEVIDEKTRTDVLGRIKGSIKLVDAAGCDVVVEAVLEDLAVKTRVFKELDALLGKHAIFATNTSSISITAIAAQTARADRFIGMHFMNPVPVMKLVEIIRGLATSDETAAEIVELSKMLDKVPVEVNDYPGFVSNRVLMPMINEAVYCLMEGVATAQAIDDVMKLGMNHPLGPLALADLIGLDICLNILNVLYCGLGDPKYRACPLLRKMVDAGYLGRKTGRGFFVYEKA